MQHPVKPTEKSAAGAAHFEHYDGKINCKFSDKTPIRKAYALAKAAHATAHHEHQLRLPVHRPSGESVVATKAELDGWVKASPMPEVFRLHGTDF
jgi:hypothetical protein